MYEENKRQTRGYVKHDPSCINWYASGYNRTIY